MTLYRQLLIWMLIVFFTLITSVFVIQFNTTRNFLREQQSTEIDNAISAVGLAVSPYLESGDTIATESVINATFDSSFYSSVSLDLLQDELTIERTYPEDISGVPEWFRNTIEIEPIAKSTTLTSGWMQLASLSVTSNPAYAYLKLWQATIQLTLGFITSFFLGAVILAMILSKVLKPLKAIQSRAKEMSVNQFGQALTVPRTRELSDVVKAFNHMSAQLKLHFEQQAQEADRLRVRAFQDPVSGLANRSYLLTQLESWLGTSAKGGIALLKVDLIKDRYEQNGYEAGDQLVQNLASRIKNLASDNFTIARLSQAEFVLLAPNTSASELTSIGRTMLHMSSELQSDPLDVRPVQAAVGLVVRRDSDTISSILAQADNALMQARQQPKEPLALFDTSQQTSVMGKLQWKALVDEAIANKLFKLKFQKAINDKGEPLHEEVFAYIEKGDKYYSAGQFVGAVEQLNAGAQLDRHILEKLFQQLTANPELGPIAVNITQSSISDTGFIRWLSNKMKSYQSLSDRILFELPEISFIKHSNDTDLLCEMIHQNNFAFGIDNFGHNFGSLSSLNKLRPAYVKLDFAYTNQIDDEAKADLLTSITRTANNLSIVTIASRVETTKQQEKLAALMVKGFQGFVVDEMNNEKTV
ncbi:EAL domain-containing protein [Photobacterium sp. SDRW27]|uniref:bifunctional diguanylate cyclase/phosphodiesterase n=1 Tax=Photobacterium obscurum TaxID=2829490 RepID=UPI0022445075|nr:EAL domain-containing protein [Photobacterium obscurum]MCW8327187.1 EAL domain-containing protein [Photobacterium obscurum]